MTNQDAAPLNPFAPPAAPAAPPVAAGTKIVELDPALHFIMRESKIEGFEVKPLKFKPYVDIAMRSAENPAVKLEVGIQRGRVLAQCRAITSAGDRLAFEEFDLLTLPIKAGKILVESVHFGEGVEGKILEGSGDGITSPILYELGTPVSATSKGASAPIDELEFHATTFGQVEEIIAETQPLRRAVALITTVARPSDLLAMPAWVADEITIADGFKILSDILPRFFE